MDQAQLKALHKVSPQVFSRLALQVTRWARTGSFDFDFCDVLADRLKMIYDLVEVREKAEATTAAFMLSVSHNRWMVMRCFMRMAGAGIGDDLADRLAVEMFTLDYDAVANLRRIEEGIHAQRTSLHPKIRKAIQEIERRHAE